MGHGRGDFLFCSRDPAWVPRPCLTWRHMSSCHMPEPGAPTSGNRQLVPIARPLVWSCIGRSTSRQWKHSSTIPLACSKPRSRVTGGQQPGTPLEWEGFTCSDPPFAACSSSVDTPPCSHCRQPPADNVMSKQSSFFGTATLMRAADLAGPAPASQRVKEQKNRECHDGIRRPDLSVRAHSGYKVTGAYPGHARWVRR